MKESYLFLAEGFEEIEALTAVDVLRRAGLPVKMVSITSEKEVKGAHGVCVEAEALLGELSGENAEWLILPGGMPGAKNLYECEALREMLVQQFISKTGRIAAICAAPAIVLGQMGLLKGRKATCYPGFEDYLEGSEVENAPVVCDDKFVLGNGPANALRWALHIVGHTFERRDAVKIANDMLYYPSVNKDLENYFG